MDHKSNSRNRFIEGEIEKRKIYRFSNEKKKLVEIQGNC